jgi:hypothetical protein
MDDEIIKKIMEKHGFKYPTDKNVLNLARELFEKGIQEKINVCGIVGKEDWEDFRAKLVIALISCKNEKDFFILFERLLNGIGTPKNLAKQREKLGLKPFDEEELDQIEVIENEHSDKKINKTAK